MKEPYILHMMYRDGDGKLQDKFIETCPLSKTAAKKAGKDYAASNNMRCFQVFPAHRLSNRDSIITFGAACQASKQN